MIPRWLFSPMIGLLAGGLLVAAGYVGLVGAPSMAAVQASVLDTAVDVKWSLFPPTRASQAQLVALRDVALDQIHRTRRQCWTHLNDAEVPCPRAPVIIDPAYPQDLSPVDGAKFEVISEEEAQSRADLQGDYPVYTIGAPEFTWSGVQVGLHQSILHREGRRGNSLAGWGRSLGCEPFSQTWRCDLTRSWVG